MSQSDAAPLPPERMELRRLFSIGWVLCATYLCLAVLSQWFSWHSPLAGRPVWVFLILMTVAFVLHLWALKIAIGLKRNRTALRWIILFGLGYRLLLLPSHPIQEVDIYRYMWDGLVTADGQNPYHFSPRDTLHADSQNCGPEIGELVRIRDSSDSVHTTLSRVHFAHLTTIYPPVSQAVFAAAATVTPLRAYVEVRRFVTKFFIVLFDVLAMFGLLALLQHFRKPTGWLICYAWSPLVLKEFANSGHLDAIAVGFTVWAVVFWSKALRQKSAMLLSAAAVLLGLGIGAKLSPVVAVPVIAVSVLRHFGFRQFAVSGALVTVVSAITLWPMLATKIEVPTVQYTVAETSDVVALSNTHDPPLPADFDEVTNSAGTEQPPRVPVFSKDRDSLSETVATPSQQATGEGLSAFMGSWKMNDLFFLIVNENLTPESAAWFSILSDTTKRQFIVPVADWRNQSAEQAAFGVSRAITAVIHILITAWLAAAAWRANLRQLPGLVFLSVAWFWLLLPTLNPWYWIWAMPLLPFARLRSWLFMSCCVTIYYSRFWLQNTWGAQMIPGTTYDGRAFFNFVVVWLEYVPLFIVLCMEQRRRTTRQKRSEFARP
ncbi:MAG TPA: hypothetical protein EYG03_02435 [Planctomycetes bacterium]|nr:hypothetical protein [Planctomycetota bacterium]